MIHLAFNIDSNYVKYCAVTLVSIFENNKHSSFSIHIIADNLKSDDYNVLKDIIHKYNNLVYFYAPNMDLLKGFSIKKFSNRISLATYFRCILSTLIPNNIDKILYLDCDIIVRGDITPFWETPLDDIGVAAVEDIGCNEDCRYDILAYPKKYSYFNAGVLLINLAYWRDNNIAQACVDYYNKYPERILFNDQCLLNSILHKNKTLVDLKWNVQDGFYRNKMANRPEWIEMYAKTLRNPIILHYTNRKPWDYDSQHPLRNEYFKYLAFTPWKDDIVLKKFSNRLKRFFRLLPFSLRLRSRKYIDISKL